MMNGDKMHPPAKTVCAVSTKLNKCKKNTVCGTEGRTEPSCEIIQLENNSCVKKNTEYRTTCGCMLLLSYYFSLEGSQGEHC